MGEEGAGAHGDAAGAAGCAMYWLMTARSIEWCRQKDALLTSIVVLGNLLKNKEKDMKVVKSLKSAKSRHPDCQIVKRRGRLYVICKTNPRFKAVQK